VWVGSVYLAHGLALGRGTYIWGKGPRIKCTRDEGPVGDGQLPRRQANIDTLFRWELLVCEALEKYLCTGGKRTYCLA
jgi:hypothetical protein